MPDQDIAQPAKREPRFTIPSRTDWHTYAAVLYGVILLVWLSTESTNMILTSFLGVGAAFGVLGLGIMHRYGGRVLSFHRWVAMMVGLGAAVGLGATAMTFFLMLFKNVQHAHVVPDFPWEMVSLIWLRAPAWTVAGALVGAAIGLLRLAFFDSSDTGADPALEAE
ncbi:MAG: hypothetical protein GYB66_15015 [Chloroflexi bacterium]|nr:hypothetical protein [Chloroflexota bacterium]